jgi:hypothetical protein
MNSRTKYEYKTQESVQLTTFSKGWDPNTLYELRLMALDGVQHKTTACWPTRVVYSSIQAFSFL